MKYFFCRTRTGVLRFTDATHAVVAPIGATIFTDELAAQACLLSSGYSTSAEVHRCRCETGTTSTSLFEFLDTDDILVGVRKQNEAREGGKTK